MIEQYFKTNQETWNKRLELHLDSKFYNLTEFLNGKNTLNSIELDLLGNIEGKSVLHLQCHFGQDTISLSRMGAKVTGVDLSDKAIEKARTLATELNEDVTFINCNVYDLPQHLNQKFDIVFTSYGTISWLPNLNEWANIISQYLKPSGTFVFAEFHPVVWMFDDDFEQIGYNYFNDGPQIEQEIGTYADKSSNKTFEYVNWNHSLSEVMNSLLNNGLIIEQFNEFDYSPYGCFNGALEIAPEQFVIDKLKRRIPMVYSIKAKKF